MTSVVRGTTFALTLLLFCGCLKTKDRSVSQADPTRRTGPSAPGGTRTLAGTLSVTPSPLSPAGALGADPEDRPVDTLKLGDEVRRVTPGRVVNTPIRGEWGMATTWDGRILVSASESNANPFQWEIRVFRPEAVRTDDDGRPRLEESSYSPAKLFSFAQGAAPGGTALTLAIASDTSLPQNPYPSDAHGNAIAHGAGNPDFVTYSVFLYSNWEVTVSGGRIHSAIGHRRARIVVCKPNTPQADIAEAVILTSWQALRTPAGHYIQGIEPTVTADGRLLMFQSHYLLDGVTPDSPIAPIGYVMYSFNTVSNGTSHWSCPKTLNRLYEDRNQPIAGTTLGQLYPLARHRLRRPDGSYFPTSADPLPNSFGGAYPWLDPDGFAVWFTATQDGTTNARRQGISVVGSYTNWGVRVIDGPLNYNRYGKVFAPGFNATTLLFTGTGLYSGRWEPYAESKTPFPYLKRKNTVSLFSGMSRVYGEVDLDEGLSGHYVVSYHMNNSIVPDPSAPDSGYIHDIKHTPDTSGNFHCGQLVGGAVFPQEYTGMGTDAYLGDSNRKDEIGAPELARFAVVRPNDCATSPRECYPGRDIPVGISGQGVLIPESGAVIGHYGPAFERLRTGFTFHMFVKPLRRLPAWHTLARIGGRFQISIDENGVPRATVTRHGGSTMGTSLRRALPVNQWVHLAVTYDPNGQLKLYADGQLASIAQASPGELACNQESLVIGPHLPGASSTQALYIVDEVALLDVVQTTAEIARAAFIPETPALAGVPAPAAGPQLAGMLRLPTGLRAADAVAPPTGAFSRSIVRLGERLFHDTILSRDSRVSCASCHDSRLAFTDGRATSPGLNGTPLFRNAPTLGNMLFTRTFMWDARERSLERQALLPLNHPNEMGLPTEAAVVRLSARPDYVALFGEAFGGPPSAEGLVAALAAFERTILSGDSPADRFEAGEFHALNASARRGRQLFFGKAFCFRCHSGSNFTDDQTHVVSLLPLDPNDPGRFLQTQRLTDRGAFKTPSLRNVAVTGPYFHNGSVATLREVVEKYNAGPLPESCPNTNDPRMLPLSLNETEKADLVGYLEALTGRTTAGEESLGSSVP